MRLPARLSTPAVFVVLVGVALWTALLNKTADDRSGNVLLGQACIAEGQACNGVNGQLSFLLAGVDQCCPGLRCINGICQQQGSICGNGVLDVGEQCDPVLPGSDCCTLQCTFKTAGTICRAGAGICDIGESCTGGDAECPMDGFEPANVTCRASTAACDPAEKCTGNGVDCPIDTNNCAASSAHASSRPTSSVGASSASAGASSAASAGGSSQAQSSSRPSSAGASSVAASSTPSSAAASAGSSQATADLELRLTCACAASGYPFLCSYKVVNNGPSPATNVHLMLDMTGDLVTSNFAALQMIGPGVLIQVGDSTPAHVVWDFFSGPLSTGVSNAALNLQYLDYAPGASGNNPTTMTWTITQSSPQDPNPSNNTIVVTVPPRSTCASSASSQNAGSQQSSPRSSSRPSSAATSGGASSAVCSACAGICAAQSANITARCTDITTPSTVTMGQQFNASMTFKNTGQTTWTPQNTFIAGSGLSPNIPIPSTVPPGQSFTWQQTVTAAADPVTLIYVVGQNGQDHATITSCQQAVTVESSPTTGANVAQCMGVVDSPLSAVTGQPTTIHVRMRNAGTATWTPGSYVLTAGGPGIVGGAVVGQLQQPVAPGEIANMDATFTPGPNTPGNNNYIVLTMMQGSSNFFDYCVYWFEPGEAASASSMNCASCQQQYCAASSAGSQGSAASSCTNPVTSILSMPGLQSIIVYEQSSGPAPVPAQSYTFPVNDARLRQDIAQGPGTYDFSTGAEHYDVFISNAQGVLDPNGAYVTIESNRPGNNANQDTGNNIDAVRLRFGNANVHANAVAKVTLGTGLSGAYQTNQGYATRALGAPDAAGLAGVTFLGDGQSAIVLGFPPFCPGGGSSAGSQGSAASQVCLPDEMRVNITQTQGGIPSTTTVAGTTFDDDEPFPLVANGTHIVDPAPSPITSLSGRRGQGYVEFFARSWGTPRGVGGTITLTGDADFIGKSDTAQTQALVAADMDMDSANVGAPPDFIKITGPKTAEFYMYYNWPGDAFTVFYGCPGTNMSSSAGSQGSGGSGGSRGSSVSSGASSSQIVICGNGRREGYEQCDDGNTQNGDCCNRLCTIENGCSCTSGGGTIGATQPSGGSWFTRLFANLWASLFGVPSSLIGQTTPPTPTCVTGIPTCGANWVVSCPSPWQATVDGPPICNWEGKVFCVVGQTNYNAICTPGTASHFNPDPNYVPGGTCPANTYCDTIVQNNQCIFRHDPCPAGTRRFCPDNIGKCSPPGQACRGDCCICQSTASGGGSSARGGGSSAAARGNGDICTPVCGDGIVKAPEECDDGDTVNGDGCADDCTEEAGWTCDDGTATGRNGIGSCQCPKGQYWSPDQTGSSGQCITGTKSCNAVSTVIVPVCGCNGKTYQNECYAIADGVKIFTVGACAAGNNSSTTGGQLLGGAPVCGDGRCEGNEQIPMGVNSYMNCCEDCFPSFVPGPVCGDGICESERGEVMYPGRELCPAVPPYFYVCPRDCCPPFVPPPGPPPTCGNGICETDRGEIGVPGAPPVCPLPPAPYTCGPDCGFGQ